MAGKGKSKRIQGKGEYLDKTVKDNVEVILFDGQQLKAQRGKSFMLSLKKSKNARELLTTSFNNHSSLRKNFKGE